MVRTLDSRSSQNMSYPSVQEEFYGIEPVLIAQVGLTALNPGAFIRVHFSGIFGVSTNPISSSEVLVSAVVVRGSSSDTDIVFVVDNIIDLLNVKTQSISFTGSDYDVPPPANDLLVYSCFIYTNLDGVIFRRGPESFNATAYCDD